MPFVTLRLFTLLIFLTIVQAVSWSAKPFNPPAVPLAVRTPYLSAWLPQGAGMALNDVWPIFWTGQTLGWAGLLMVDGTAYSFLGTPNVPGMPFEKAAQKSSQFTATRSIFVLTAGSVDVTVTFLSPVEATDLVKQSTPFAYMAVSAASNDNAAHSVQVYSDITAEWVSANLSDTVEWSTSAVGNVITHQFQSQLPSVFSEYQDHVQYGSVFYSMQNTPNTTYQTGGDAVVRTQFVNHGQLTNSQETNFRAINASWPVLGLAHDLGSVIGPTSPVVFSVGYIRDPAIQYVVGKGTNWQNRSLYFWSQFSTVSALISSFLGDYNAALSRAQSLDSKVNSDGSKISADYAAIVELSIRQAVGATEITISRNPDGTWNTDDVIVFLKEISGENANTVDVIFPAWPCLVYLNPALGKYLLEGLFRYQANGLYPHLWSVHDLGSGYPRALGHNDGNDGNMFVEESGNMLITALSYAQKTGDNSQLAQYTTLLDQWAQYLIKHSLLPEYQSSTDNFAGALANQTNLAVKGIIGIKAMSQIYSILGNTAQSSNYSSIAADYVTQWQTLAMSSTGPHLTLSYGNSTSWGLTYNLYADKLLKLDLFPASIYDLQTAWYETVAQHFGVPLDSRHTYTKTDWQIWTAAIVTNTTIRDMFISSVKNYAADGLSSQPFGDWYETTNGQPEGFRARPVVGGHLALVS
ncbi:hypothetical protein H2248_006474 [Termitomyces sp. 'cryptogamus']|nr:hypothetical protein H2248_006474 [Termitomyces sp. 'cryptogamus']